MSSPIGWEWSQLQEYRLLVIHRFAIGIENLKNRCHRTKHSPFVRDHRKFTVLV